MSKQTPSAVAMRIAAVLDNEVCEYATWNRHDDIKPVHHIAAIVDKEIQPMVEALDWLHHVFHDPMRPGEERHWCSGDHERRKAALAQAKAALDNVKAKQ